MTSENTIIRGRVKGQRGFETDIETPQGVLTVRIAKGKEYVLLADKVYDFAIRQDSKGTYWLNGAEEVTQDIVTSSFDEEIKEFLKRKPDSETYKQFQTDKRTAWISAVDYWKGQGGIREDEIRQFYELALKNLLRFYR